jgi:hypothetical protein
LKNKNKNESKGEYRESKNNGFRAKTTMNFVAALFVFFISVHRALQEIPKKLYVIISAFYLALNTILPE